MSHDITQLEPHSLWEHFYTLSQIPRPSKHEQQVTEHLRNLGQRLGFETVVEPIGNVIIRKPATPGMEKRKGIILQAHTDMVPQKNADTQHDFLTDPIDTYHEDGWVKARGTTLGADNGIGVAAMMAVLTARDLKHGPLEMLFTVDEETENMAGASNLSPDVLLGDILINLDGERGGRVCIGCSGGRVATVDIPCTNEQLGVENPRKAFSITIKGLLGGHSAGDINRGRGNAIRFMMRLLKHLQEFDPRIATLNAGTVDNAIPRECFATVVLPLEKASGFITAVAQFEQVVKEEYTTAEPAISISAEEVDKPKEMLTHQSQQRLIGSVLSCPNGIIRMNDKLPGHVETSNNVAAIHPNENGYQLLCLMRSNHASAMQAVSEEMQALFSLVDAQCRFFGDFPAWTPNINSPILASMKRVYRLAYGKEPDIFATHGGLECGTIAMHYPKLDIIAMGPTILYPHSPDECVNVKSVQHFWDFLTRVLENVDSK